MRLKHTSRRVWNAATRLSSENWEHFLLSKGPESCVFKFAFDCNIIMVTYKLLCCYDNDDMLILANDEYGAILVSDSALLPERFSISVIEFCWWEKNPGYSLLLAP
ncbi:hypothetical protein VNO77_19587 [Canavalia gladiata]|uniref:Uncharacterized protein n=1 Tax=Canavalia gladiata TaxID=3824 RepID=A0AAN9LRK7_CANGL